MEIKDKERRGEERYVITSPGLNTCLLDSAGMEMSSVADSFYNFISCTDPSFIMRRRIATHTETPSDVN